MTDNIVVIALNMLMSGLPETFVLRAVALARESEGVEDMLHLWQDEASERDAVVAELQAALEDREPGAQAFQVRDSTGAEGVLEERMRQKAHIRSLIEERGGVSEIAKAAGLPQPSLSRFLNTPSEPRPHTLHRLATAMGLEVADLTPTSSTITADRSNESFDVRSGYVARPKYGSTRPERRQERSARRTAHRLTEARQ